LKTSVEGIFVAPKRGAPMQRVDSVEALAGVGLRGDRYTRVKSRHTDHYQVTLIELENIEAFVAASGLALTPDMPRRNLVTRGVRLNALCGKRFFVGGVLMEGCELCEPCRLFAKRTYPEVVELFGGKGGLRAKVLGSGVIRCGDSIREES
jgi:MOSC domain-containing protein YiiM